MTKTEKIVRNIFGTILAIVLTALVINSFINPQPFVL